MAKTDMMINCKKNKCMTFLPRYKRNRFINIIPNFKLEGILIDFCDSFHYLGHIICNTFNDRADVISEIRSIFFKYNRLCNRFNYCSWEMKKALWNSYVNCLYGVRI